MVKNFIKRDIFDSFKAHLSQKEMTLLVGPRQVGKTTLLYALEDDLKSHGSKTIFLNLDIEQDRQFFVSQEALIQHIRLSLGADGGYVFIDEAQRKEDAGKFFKGIYDMNLPYKFILSGSGSLELKEKIHESMAGRKRIFELMPVSFKEFAAFKTSYKYGDKLIDAFRQDALHTSSLLEEYLRFGGYPKVIVTPEAKEKLEIINEIHQSYLMRDISFLLGVEKTDAFANLMRLIANQVGNLTAISELASSLGVSAPTIKNYLWYLEKTYIISRVSPYFKNARKEVAKMPVFYFNDLGMRNFAAHSNIVGESDGFLFENFIFLLLRNKFNNFSNAIRFWRTKSGAEVDFVVDLVGENAPIPFEAKYGSLRKPIIGKSLHSFIERYHPNCAYIVTKKYSYDLTVGSTAVRFTPFYEIPFLAEVSKKSRPDACE